MRKKATRKRPYFTMESAMTAILRNASGKMHHGILFAPPLDSETAFLDEVVYKGLRFKEKSILDAKTHFKQTKTFFHTHFTSCHPPNVKKWICQRRSLKNPTEKLLRNNL